MFGPIFRWEAVRLVRSWKHFRLRSIFGLCLAGGVAYAWIATFGFDSATTGGMARFGTQAVHSLVFVQTAVVYLFAPLLLAGSLAEERARGRLELLRTTHLSSREIVWDKFAFALASCGLFWLAGTPFFLAMALFGGVEPDKLLQALAAVAVNTVAACAASTYCASKAADRISSAMNSYVLLTLWALAAPLATELLLPNFGQWPIVDPRIAALSPTWATLYPWQVNDQALGSFGWALAAPLLPSLWFVWRAVALLPKEPRRRSLRSTAKTRQTVSHLDPIGWRANVLGAYDPHGRIRRMHAVAYVVVIVLTGFGYFRVEFLGLATFLAVLYAYAAALVLPALLLFADRERGWQRELYGTTLEVRYIHDATVDAVWKKVEPACLTFVAVEAVGFAVALIGDVVTSGLHLTAYFVGSTIVRAAFYFIAYWPIRAAFWQSVRDGVAHQTLAAAVGATLRRSLTMIVVGQLLLAVLTFAVFGLLAPFFFIGLILLFPLGPVLIAWGYVAYYNSGVRLAKNSTEAMLSALDETRLFGETGGLAALGQREKMYVDALRYKPRKTGEFRR